MINRVNDVWLVALAYTDLPSDARVIRSALECARRGARVTLLVPRSKREDFNLPGVEIVWLPTDNQRGKTTLRGQLRFMRAIRNWAKQQVRRPDVVHVHNMPDYLYWAVRGWQKAGSRVVLDVHDVMSELALHRFGGPKRHLAARALRFMERAVWKRVDHVITVHDFYEGLIVDSGIDPKKVSVVLNVPDPEACRPSMRKEPTEDAFKVVFHGTVSSRTGVIHAVRAMPILQELVPNATLTIIGSGNGAGAVNDVIKELDLERSVNFLDSFLPMSDVIEHICDAHVGVVPNELSIFTKGILPVKLLEYATLGIPVVATRLPIVERYVGEKSIYHIDTPKPELIAEGLARVALDDQFRNQLIAAGRRFHEQHGWRRYGPVLTDALIGPLGLRVEDVPSLPPRKPQPQLTEQRSWSSH